MCNDCLKTSSRFWMRLVNALELLAGLLFLSYGGFLAYKAPAAFTYLLVVNGAAMVVTSGLGLCGVGSKHKCILSIYSVLLLALMAIHIALAVLCLKDKDRVLNWIADHSSDNEQVTKLQDFARDHIAAMGYISALVAVLEALTLLVSCCLRNKLVKDAREEWDDDFEASGRAGLLETPKTDDQRARMNEKYGNVFRKDNVQATSSSYV